MPMYDFVCTACGNKFEDLVFGDEVPACPKCNSAATEKQLCVPSPLKTGAFPYRPGPAQPAADLGLQAAVGALRA